MFLSRGARQTLQGLAPGCCQALIYQGPLAALPRGCDGSEQGTTVMKLFQTGIYVLRTGLLA